ncbi:hypothetical protein ABBQ32_004125 [Trebouxia sp. C0010 RCD-2024]
MTSHVAHSTQVNTEDSSADIAQAQKDRTDPSTAGAPLPARIKRKFAAPASVATTSKTPATAGIVKQVGTSVSVDKGNPPVEQSAQYFSVLYTKRVANKKKNKSYSDGVLEVKQGNACTLFNEEGKVVSKSKVKEAWGMPAGAELEMGNWELQVDATMDEQHFRLGQCFMQPAQNQLPVPSSTSLTAGLSKTSFRKPLVSASAVQNKAPATTEISIKQQAVKPVWLHNPHAEGAVVLNQAQWQQAGEGGAVWPVVVDPHVGRHLRPHQSQGVQFLYECIMGLREANRFGAVLADEMGLGKTLQVIALLWTLIKQGPQGKPVAKRVIVVTPSTLTQNWAAEVQKWLGAERCKALTMQPGAGAESQVRDFKHGTVWPIMIVSYETLRKFAEGLAGFCDVLICDEGHRLKAAQGSKTMTSLLALGCQRRILLTGTPVQNNLDEFFAMISFVNPDLLGNLATFKRVFADPISKSQDRSASPEEQQLGQERSKELSRRVDSFVLRRTNEINARYLPALTSYVIFCKPSDLQVELYKQVLQSKSVAALMSGRASEPSDGVLSIITTLRKLCNHPDLLHSSAGNGEAGSLEQLFPLAYHRNTAEHSGKMRCLKLLLHSILSRDSPDKAVIVSNSTAALDLVQALCQQQSYSTVRIDGATDVNKRQDIVNSFNLYGSAQICLLSTRAGGAGLNLVGANRLVLFDSDWNPAVDLQAMARVWRDGQRKPCLVYRLLTTGTIDEKIYQRQLMKGQIANMMEGQGAGKGKKGGAGSGFSVEDLKELFKLRLDTPSDTHDLLCKGSASQGKSAAKGLPSIDHGAWQDASASVEDHALQAAVADGVVTFVHSAAGMQDKLKQDSTPRTDYDAAGIESWQQASETDSQKNKGPAGVQHVESIDDVTCLELE